jgi:amino acid adenylation domain-containing protein
MAGDGVRSGLASFGQEQLWLVEQAMPGTGVYNVARVWDLFGPLDAALLRDCVDTLVARHDVLHTALRHEGGRLWQYVQPVGGTYFAQTVAEDPGTAARILDEQLAAPFDLAEGSVFRAVLIRLEAGHHIFALMLHHAACDGLSHAVIRDDLVALYEAGDLKRRECPLLEVGKHIWFAEIERAEWEAGAAEAEGWLKWLEEVAAEHAETAHGPKRTLVGAAGWLEYTVGAADLGPLLERAADAGVTPNMALNALFAVTLSRWSGREKVIFSTPVDTRMDPRLHRAVGMFTNSLPMVLDVGRNPTFTTLLERSRDAVLTALRYAYVAPVRIQAALAVGAPESDLLHQATLNVENAGSPHFQMGAARAVERRLPQASTAFGLSADVELTATSARIHVGCDRAVYPAEQARRFGDQFAETIAAAGTAGREADLPRLPSADRSRLRTWSQGPDRKDVADFAGRVAHVVQENPGAPAVSEGERTLTYRELWDESAKYAQRLRELGAGAEDVVAICLPRSIGLLAAVLGTLRTGAAFMPLDTRNPAIRTRRQLTDMGAKILVAVDRELAGGWDGLLLSPDTVQDLSGTAPASEYQPAEPDSLAYIITTSGSTGAPKGVMVSHRGLASYLQWAVDEYGLGSGSRVPLHSSPAFDMAITSLLGPLYAGAEIHVLPEDLGPLALVERFRDGYRIAKGTPSHLSAVLAEPETRGPGQPPSVVVFGGENWPTEQARHWAARIPGSILVNEYGPAETVVGSTAYTVSGPVSSAFVPIGRPIANTWVQVVDADLQPVPVGIRGELVIGGAGVARGYRRAPARTAERFVPDPFGPEKGGRLYRTGDIAFWNTEGQLELIGRGDDQIKILGYRVEPGEVEAALTQCPGIRQAAVVTDRRGDRHRLVAYCVFKQDSGPAEGPERVKDYLRQVLPPHMIPETVVGVAAMPLSSSGKIDRSALPEPPDSPGPVKPAAPPEGDGYWHTVVRDAWLAVLPHDSIPDGATFFEADGNSLMLLQLLTELIERGVPGLTVTDLFRFPTIASLADRIGAISADLLRAESA